MPARPPFTDQHFRQLQEAQRVLGDTVELLDKAERCGIDCQAFRMIHGELSSRLAKLQQEFFGGIPSDG